MPKEPQPRGESKAPERARQLQLQGGHRSRSRPLPLLPLPPPAGRPGETRGSAAEEQKQKRGRRNLRPSIRFAVRPSSVAFLSFFRSFVRSASYPAALGRLFFFFVFVVVCLVQSLIRYWLLLALCPLSSRFGMLAIASTHSLTLPSGHYHSSGDF